MANATPSVITKKPKKYKVKVSKTDKKNVKGQKIVISSVDTVLVKDEPKTKGK